MERDQREDSVFPGKGPEGGFRRDGKEMLGINHQEIEQSEQYNLLHRLSAQLRVTRTGRHGKHAEKLDLYLISGEQRKQEVPSYEIVCETLDYLRSLGLIDDDDDLYEFLKKFPGVLIGCSLEHELRSDMKKETLHGSSFKVFNHRQIQHAMPVHSFKVRKLQHLEQNNHSTWEYVLQFLVSLRS
ncbi:hypothetical protein NC651_040255 [Populus alba x Populus x berolinensis]|nr:hypothetical protein NC651_040255 [Populus alba x Populus x berolinensis]